MPVADGELRVALERVLHRPVRSLARSAHPYGSSHPIEHVEVAFERGGVLALVFKDTSAPTAHASRAKPLRLRDPDREIEVYTGILARAGLDAAACYGAISQPGRRWLFLEAVAGVPLWQTAGTEAWLHAARWLARLHARSVPACGGRLLRYDEAYLRGLLERARACAAGGTLDGVAAIWPDAVRRVAAWPAALVHGDFHPSNILVEADAGAIRIRPVDWELAGVGPGLLDLAALTSGGWSAAERERMALAYHEALPPRLRPGAAALLDALTAARLLHAIGWVGSAPGWTPPPEHAHDWLGEACLLAAELGR